MCGRFAFFSPREAVARAFPAAVSLISEPRYNITPGQNVLAIHLDSAGNPVGENLRWGLVPFWAKEPSAGARMINARVETLTEKPSWRQSFARRRCLVLADGFYEWRLSATGKTPYFISASDGQPFGMAGLWDQWDKGANGPLRSCAVITVPADEFMQPLHARMPVAMDWDAGQYWLDTTVSSELLLQMLRGGQSVRLRAWPVAKAVNNPLNDNPQLIEAVEG